jgi:hypothetical protein
MPCASTGGRGEAGDGTRGDDLRRGGQSTEGGIQNEGTLPWNTINPTDRIAPGQVGAFEFA